MKKSIILNLALILSITSFSQNSYKVVRVNGRIIIEKTSTDLIRGAIYNDADKLLFKTENSRATVINKTGRFVLMPNDNSTAYAKANLIPSMNNISSRSGAIITKLDLQNYFSNNCVILNEINLRINSEEFPMSENNFFFINYTYKGEKISKKLGFEKDILKINKKKLLTVDNKTISEEDISNVELYYLINKNKMELINKFNLIFIYLKELKEEVKIIISQIEDKTKDEKIKEITLYINETYGVSNNKDITEWINKNFDL